jgi:hypothetical protein
MSPAMSGAHLDDRYACKHRPRVSPEVPATPMDKLSSFFQEQIERGAVLGEKRKEIKGGSKVVYNIELRDIMAIAVFPEAVKVAQALRDKTGEGVSLQVIAKLTYQMADELMEARNA